MLKLDLSCNKKTITLFLNKVIDFKESKNINEYLMPLLLKYDIENVVVDLSKTKKINSSGYNSLIKVNWIMKVKKGRLYFTEVPEYFQTDFKRLKFTILKDNKRKEVFV